MKIFFADHICDSEMKDKRTAWSRFWTLLAVAVLCVLTGCGVEQRYGPITDVNDLEGRRVGVNLAWAEDFFLQDRKDLTLYRYDSTADMVLALKYDKIDAMALDDAMWAMVKSVSYGVEKVEPPIGETGYILYFGGDKEELAQDFNSFLLEYKKTEDYQDLLERVADFDGEYYYDPEIPLTGTGEVLDVAFTVNGFPRSLQDPGADATGFDLEALKLYANDRGYRLKFHPTYYEDASIGLRNGTYDIYTGYLSDEYASDVVQIGLLVSDPLYTAPLYFVQKTQPDIHVSFEELE